LIPKYLKTKKCPLKCQELNASCFIEPDGSIYPCTIFPRKIGNVRKFKTAWKEGGKLSKMIREKKCPRCWTPCLSIYT